jgi:hypothetical protein
VKGAVDVPHVAAEGDAALLIALERLDEAGYEPGLVPVVVVQHTDVAAAAQSDRRVEAAARAQPALGLDVAQTCIREPGDGRVQVTRVVVDDELEVLEALIEDARDRLAQPARPVGPDSDRYRRRRGAQSWPSLIGST